jgi:hypothetical protein
MLMKIGGLARAIYIVLAIVGGFVALTMMNLPLVLVVLGLIAGLAMTEDRQIAAMLLVIVLPIVGMALAQIPAIGAQLGRPDHLVIDIAGDGSIQMNSQEMATAAINGVPVKVVVINNGYLGMVRQWQELFWGNRYSSSTLPQDCPDFVKLADAYGWKGYRVSDPAELEATLREAFDAEGPAMVDVRVAREECVYPMVAPGASIDVMLGGVPGCPVSEMLDDDLLEEVWE